MSKLRSSPAAQLLSAAFQERLIQGWSSVNRRTYFSVRFSGAWYEVPEQEVATWLQERREEDAS